MGSERPQDTVQGPLFDPSSAEFHADPYPVYRRLREEFPIYRHPAGYWLWSRYRDCVSVLHSEQWEHTDDFGCITGDGLASVSDQALGPRSVIARMRLEEEHDPARARYARTQRAVGKGLSTAVVRRLEQRVQHLVDELLDAAIDQGEVDLVPAFAYPLAGQAMCEIFGIPPADRAIFKGWVDDIVRGVDAIFDIPRKDVERRDRASAAFAEYFRGLIAERRRQPRDDMLSALATLEGDDGASRLSEQELLASCVLVLIAGYVSSADLIGDGTLALLRHPDQLKLFGSDPEIAPSAVEEFLRYDSPAQFIFRKASRDMVIEGHSVREGDLALVFLAAANRDPEAFAEPDRLDLLRTNNRHIAFGSGHHACLGAALNRMESRIAFKTLMSRAPRIELTGEPTYKSSCLLRGLAGLPVKLR